MLFFMLKWFPYNFVFLFKPFGVDAHYERTQGALPPLFWSPFSQTPKGEVYRRFLCLARKVCISNWGPSSYRVALYNSLFIIFFFCFKLFSYNFTKIKIESFECPKSIRNSEKKWCLEHQTLGRWVISPSNPGTLCISYWRLLDFKWV